MNATLAIAKREILAFFVSPIAYVVLTGSLLWNGISFYALAQFYASNPSHGSTDTPISFFFGGTTLFFIPLLVIVPILTMRLIAEEKRSGTIEPLLTAPVTEASLVFGKYIASLVFWIAIWFPTLMYVWLTSRYGSVDLGAVAASYLGIFGIGVYYMAIGVLGSALARNQIVAAMLTFMALGVLFVFGIFSQIMVGSDYEDLFTYMSVWGHMAQFSRGVIDTRPLIFDASIAIVALYFAVRVMSNRSRGAA